MSADYRLTPEMQEFASENHDLIYGYLQRKGLKVDEFYEIVMFGFLKAVYRYYTEPALRSYRFSTIAYKRMDACLKRHFKKQAGQPQTVSIEWDCKPCTASDSLMAELQLKLTLQQLAKDIPAKHMIMIQMRSEGYSLRKIGEEVRVSPGNVQEVLDNVSDTLQELCYN